LPMWFTTYLPRKPVAPKTVLVIPLRLFVRLTFGGESEHSRLRKRRKTARCRGFLPAARRPRIRESLG